SKLCGIRSIRHLICSKLSLVLCSIKSTWIVFLNTMCNTRACIRTNTMQDMPIWTVRDEIHHYEDHGQVCHQAAAINSRCGSWSSGDVEKGSRDFATSRLAASRYR